MAISIKAIERHLGRHIAQTHVDPKPQIKRLRKAFQRHERGEITRIEVLDVANDVIGGHGIEAIQPEGDGHNVLALYVNVGDPYAATVLYSYRARRFVLTSWGDFYARTPEYRRATRAGG